MKSFNFRSTLLATTTLGVGMALAGLAPAAQAQSAGDQQAAQIEEVVVTGSRIRRSSDTTSSAPVAIIGARTIEDKGFVQAGEALNEMTSISPSRAPTPALSNGQAVAGQDFPNLFNLGPARTLSLLNGRRMVSSSSGLGDEAVDTNIIPTGLLERIDVVQGGGAAVYGSGAMAGVVNYVMRDDYEGLSVMAQHGADTRDSYKASVFRLVAGQNFAQGRGNIAGEFDYSRSSPLLTGDRWESHSETIPNPAAGAGTNGVPGTIFYNGPVSIYSDTNGLVALSNSPFAAGAAGTVTQGGRGVTIDSGGNIVLRDLGTPYAFFYNLGSELDWPIPRSFSLAPRLERKIATVTGHYDLTDNITLTGEFLGARVEATQKSGGLVVAQYTGALSVPYPALSPLAFTNTNPYLTPTTIAQLSASSPAFAAGLPLYLSKTFGNLGSKYLDQRYRTDTTRAMIGLEGKFTAVDRNFFWDASYTASQVRQRVDGYSIVSSNLRRAANATRNGAGQIVCAVNATVVTDPGCVPLNIFGTEQITPQQAAYIMARSGGGVFSPVTNKQQDFLATISGDLLKLPAGQSKFSLSYEHRKEEADFEPLAEDLVPQFFSGIAATPARGTYNTNELAGEIEAPLLGGDVTLPFVKSLEFSGSFRFVDNSLAGKDTVWSAGLRWDVGAGLVLRGTRSRNFRAPSLNQVTAPAVVGLGAASHPCSRTNIGAGPAPSTRAANCLALFTANPTYGLATLPAGAPTTPQSRLSNFQGTVVAQVRTTTQGNADLENEVADTTTFGFVYLPKFIPRLAISADVIRIDLKNSIQLFSVTNFATTCFDASPQPAAFCGTLGYDAQGDINQGIASNVNAGAEVLHAEVYNIDYRLPLQEVSKLPGVLDFTLQATHNTLATVTFAGTTTRTDATQTLPEWVVRFDVHYTNGPVRLNYSANYMPSTLINSTATIENSPGGVAKLSSNTRHDLSAEYRFLKRYSVRVGVNNLTDELPSYPSLTYGDFLGRNYFAALKAEF